MRHLAFQYDDSLDPSLWDPDLTSRLLAEHGFDDDPGLLLTRWNRGSSDDGPTLTSLVEVMCQIHDLANEAGHEALLAALEQHERFTDLRELVPCDLALLAWLEQRPLFQQVHALHVAQSLGNFRVFRGRTAHPAAIDAAQRGQLQDELVGAFERRGRGVYCGVTIAQDDRRIDVEIRHGQPRRRIGLVPSEVPGEAASITVRPSQTDLVVYDLRTGLLRILASDATTTRTYRRAMGRVLFGDEGWFAAKGVLSFQPLLDHGPAALRAVGGLHEVQLREIELRLAHPDDEATITISGNDVFAILEHYGRVRISDGELISATFRLVHPSGGRPRALTLRLPNVVTFDWRRDEVAALRFLDECGFLRGGQPRRGRFR